MWNKIYGKRTFCRMDNSSPIFFAVFQKLYDGHFVPDLLIIKYI